MMRIPLTKGMWALVDDADFARVASLKWYARENRKSRTWYAERSEGEKTVAMHRFILGADPGWMVDHINGDGLDNRRENLRLATCSQNTANSRKRSATVSPFRGVRLDKRIGRWSAKIRVNNKHIHLGSFGTDREAAIAYNKAAIQHHGAFARINQITDLEESHVE